MINEISSTKISTIQYISNNTIIISNNVTYSPFSFHAACHFSTDI